MFASPAPMPLGRRSHGKSTRQHLFLTFPDQWHVSLYDAAVMFYALLSQIQVDVVSAARLGFAVLPQSMRARYEHAHARRLLMSCPGCWLPRAAAAPF